MSSKSAIDLFEATIDNMAKASVQHVCYFEFFEWDGTLQVKDTSLCYWMLVFTYMVWQDIDKYTTKNSQNREPHLEQYGWFMTKK